jgi:hypothetical protein
LTSLHVSRNWLLPFDALDAGSPRGSAAPYWLDLDREAYAAQLAELKQRVDTVLRPSYGGYLPDLPRALDFHECWLPGTMRRVSEYTRAYIGQCSTSRRLPYDWAGR